MSTNCIYVNVVGADSSLTFEDALEIDDYVLWKETMDREINCLYKNKTWKLVEEPINKKVLDLKWIFSNKSDNRKSEISYTWISTNGITGRCVLSSSENTDIKTVISVLFSI